LTASVIIFPQQRVHFENPIKLSLVEFVGVVVLGVTDVKHECPLALQKCFKTVLKLHGSKIFWVGLCVEVELKLLW